MVAGVVKAPASRPGGAGAAFESPRDSAPSAAGGPAAAAEEAGRTAARLVALYLFSGFAGKPEGLDSLLAQEGWGCEMVDIENGRQFDLAEDAVFEGWLRRIRDREFSALFMSPPCSTFSAARSMPGSGPRPLRGEHPPDLFGFAWLRGREKEQARLGTLLATRAAIAARLALDLGLPWGVETPEPRAGQPSVFKLPVFRDLEAAEGVSVDRFDQCRLGGISRKPTAIMGTLGLGLDGTRCDHENRDWVIPWSGEVIRSPHPPLRGRQRAIPVAEWDGVIAGEEPPGEFISRAAAAYPRELNRAIADAMIRARGSGSPLGPVDGPAARPADALVLPVVRPRVDPTVRLRPEQPDPRAEREYEDENCVAGLRDTAEAIERVPGHARLGAVLWDFFTLALDRRPELEKCIHEALAEGLDPGRRKELEAEIDRLVDPVRGDLGRVLGCDDLGPVTGDCSTQIRAGLLRRWADLAGDPGAGVTDWLRRGAAAGIEEDPSHVDGIFPKAAPEADRAPPDVPEPEDGYVRTLPGDRDAEEHLSRELAEFEAAGWLRRHSDRHDLEACVGSGATVSKFVVVSKRRPDGTTKYRLILDLKASGISARTRKTHRVVLPRVADVVRDSLRALSELSEGEDAELFVVDFRNAFWHIPLLPAERRHFVGSGCGFLWSFTRAAQGSRNGPLSWAGPSALVMRCTQGVLSSAVAGRRPRAKGRLYVDDPCFVLSGSPELRDRFIAVIVVIWAVLGMPIAFEKAKRGRSLVWIGAQYGLESDLVRVTIPQAKVAELKSMIDGMARANVVRIKAVRRLAGLASHVASLIWAWRPFLAELWAAIHPEGASASSSRAPEHCVWVKQIRPALQWLSAFLEGIAGTLEMVYRVRPFLNSGIQIRMVTDASVWGIGAILFVDGRPVEWLSDALTPDDEAALGIAIGQDVSQQAAEALAILVSLRVWSQYWREERAVIELRNDNVGALTLFMKLKGRSSALNTIAREAALELGNGSFRPDVFSHSPGVANVWADMLSRQFDPNKVFALPPQLADVRQAHPPSRSTSWWRSRCPAEQMG